MPDRRARVGVAAVLLAGAACQRMPVSDPATASPTTRLAVRLSDLAEARPRAIALSIAAPRAPGRPLVVHLTGDSGSHGLDLELFAALTRWGYPVALLSSPAWAGSLVGGCSSPPALARDLDRIARAAARATGVAEDRPFVLFGLSRGAGLVVEAAGEEPLRGRLRGVVALGLCPREEYVRRGRGPGRPYQDKALLGDLPLEVLQATEDRYMTAADARVAFGPDSGSQRLHAIEAESHTFRSGHAALFEQLERSLARVAETPGPEASAHHQGEVAAGFRVKRASGSAIRAILPRSRLVPQEDPLAP